MRVSLNTSEDNIDHCTGVNYSDYSCGKLFIILKYLAEGLVKRGANNILSDHNVRHENYFFQD